MPVPGRFHRSIFGSDDYVHAISANAGPVGYAMAALNAGWCARFTAPDARDVLSVYINWQTVTAAGTVELRIETVDAATGKPTGTLYDANASKSFTPASNWQQVTFDTPPTAGLTAGTEYAVVLLTTSAGTAHTLRSHNTQGSYPTVVLTAADGTTRSNFAEVANSVPVLTLVFEDSLEESLNCSPYATTSIVTLFGTNAGGMKFTVPPGTTLAVAGIEVGNQVRTGTPAGDLRFRVLDSSDSAVAGTTVTLDKDSLASVNGRRVRFHFPAVVSLAAGTYRIVLDSASSANSSNCWSFRSAVVRVAANAPSGFLLTSTTDVTAGPIVWVDTATDVPPLGLVLDDVTGSGSTPSPFVLGG